MKFTKMHGIGNDYVYVNAIENEIEDPSSLAKLVSDRHFGIGSDGLILIKASERADFMMDMYNADGSRGKMCGNGIRCVGKYVYDHGLINKKIITIETLSGIKILNLTVKPVEEVEGYKKVSNNGMVVSAVTVNMGSPIFEPEEIPIKLTGAYQPEKNDQAIVNMPIMINDTFYYGTPVSMGNPHVIVYVDDTDNFPIETIGPKFEKHDLFPEQVNTEFVQVIDRSHVKMRVWERGSGETLACGTGACATVVASIVNEKTEDEVTVSLLGGDLKIRWDRDQNTVYMTGPATTVFEGDI
ncbi:diaminopimelate epimerase [Lachnospiraceae bacterium]|nr:diaminopimelate epimerase [Lachnospiraceae bacterium]